MDKSIQVIKGCAAVFLGVLSGLLGGADSLLNLLLGLMVADFVFGCVKGWRTKNFSSAIALWGFVNKVFCLIVIFICVLLDGALGSGDTIRNVGVVWFSICEGASILENSVAIGLPLPEQLCDVLVQAKKGFSINFTKIIKQIIDNFNSEEKEGGEE